MNKLNFVIAVSVMFASGCALLENPPSESEPTERAAPPAEPQTPPVQVSLEGPRSDAPVPRSYTVDEIRRIQMRLKDAGFDPGPADGVAGARTKSALVRYQAGCDKTKTLLDDFDGSGAPIKGMPSRQENQALQLQLRAAGFDPGPADGIFGARTRRTVAQLKTNCPVVDEAAAALKDVNAPVAVGSASSGAPAAVKARAVAPLAAETARPSTVPQSKEEIRVLQLRLRDAGFDPGPFDGVMGPRTVAALQHYEASDRVKKTKASLKTTQVNNQY